MTLHDVSHDTPTGSGSNTPATGEQLARQQAIKQIERKRRFWIRATLGTLGMITLAIIWAFAEYHNAGGWPPPGRTRICTATRSCGWTAAMRILSIRPTNSSLAPCTSTCTYGPAATTSDTGTRTGATTWASTHTRSRPVASGD